MIFTNISKALFFRGFYIEIYLRISKYLYKMRKNPNWFLMSIAGRFNFIRFIIKKTAQQPNIQQYKSVSLPSKFSNIDTDTIAKILEKDGLYLGIRLPDRISQEILGFAYSTPCYANLNPQHGFLYSEKEYISQRQPLFTAQYFNTSLLCPAIAALGQDPKLLEIAAMYFGAKPIFTGSRLWWNFVVDDKKPYDSNKSITFFHYDLDDYACLRFFFYLTDVDRDSGPHVCVRGSHSNKNLFHTIWPVKRRSDDNISAYYGSENIVPICGNTGFGFAEDTFCYHKATRPLNRDRLMLQIQFAIHDYGLHNDLKDPSLLAHPHDFTAGAVSR
ncbi:MAG TPA: hypothetical protein ACFE0H_06770 [Elainellaceae cyanobacterium]